MLRKIFKIFIFPYTFLLMYLMIFGFGRTQYDDHIVRLNPIFSTIIFVKKKLLWKAYQDLAINLLGNIVMFIPFGFLGLVNQKFNKLSILLIHFLSVLLVMEALQYFTRMGIFDIDDILLNSLGVIIGFWIYKKVSLQKK